MNNQGKQGHKTIYIVYCIDAEGPLYESLEATFERVSQLHGIEMEPTQQNLLRLQRGEIPDVSEGTRLGIMKLVAPDRITFNDTWDKVDKMASSLMTEAWRKKFPDSFGNGYVYNFFCVDRLGYETNPRRRALGYHQVYDFYRSKIRETNSWQDRLYWHYHPVPFTLQAHRCANNISFTNHHIQVLSRRILDYMDFPVAFRPGCDVIRPDINLFLEQWIPFDYSNQAVTPTISELNQPDISHGRFGDFRRAPREWVVYHPDWYDYQKPGSMKRYVARCLYLRGRIRAITQDEVNSAFERAHEGKPTVMSFMSHDTRDMRPEMDEINAMINNAVANFPDVKFKYSNAVDAIREAMNLPEEKPAELDIQWNGNRLEIQSNKALWGPQPFLCFKTWDLRYYHDNLDKHDDVSWSYTFDYATIDIRALSAIGIATHDNYGNTTVCVIDMETKDVKKVYRNVEHETPISWRT